MYTGEQLAGDPSVEPRSPAPTVALYMRVCTIFYLLEIRVCRRELAWRAGAAGVLELAWHVGGCRTGSAAERPDTTPAQH